MTKFHIMYVTFQTFLEGIENLQTKCSNLKGNLRNLARVFTLNELMQDSMGLYETGYFTAGSGDMVMEALKFVIGLVRPQVIPLVESFAFPDSYLVSAIGNSYGDIYETQYEWGTNSRLNQQPVT
jgi:acyl-CoA oxidase